MPRNKLVFLIVGGIALLTITVGASAYVTKELLNDEPKVEAAKPQKITWDEPRPQPQPQQ